MIPVLHLMFQSDRVEVKLSENSFSLFPLYHPQLFVLKPSFSPFSFIEILTDFIDFRLPFFGFNFQLLLNTIQFSQFLMRKLIVFHLDTDSLLFFFFFFTIKCQLMTSHHFPMTSLIDSKFILLIYFQKKPMDNKN